MKNYVNQSLRLVIILQLAFIQYVTATAAVKFNSINYVNPSGSSSYSKPTELQYNHSKPTVVGNTTDKKISPGLKKITQNPEAASTAYKPKMDGTSISLNVHEFNPNGKDENGKPNYVIGGVKIEGTPSTDLNLFPSKIRKQMFLEEKKAHAELMAAYNKEMRTHGATAAWQKTVWGSTLKRYPTETLMFFVAIGAVNFANLLANYSNNPLLMEQHLLSLKDPIANLSFLAFMMANGYANHFLSFPSLTTRFMQEDVAQIFKKTIAEGISKGVSAKVMINEAQKYADTKLMSATKRAYGHLLPYLSMTVGSMASHIVGDFLHTLQGCVSSFNPQPNQKELSAKDPLNNLSEDPCDVAWREWTLEKKFNTYAPALASMMVSQFFSTLISSNSKKHLQIGFFETSPAASTQKRFSYRIFGWDLIKDKSPAGMVLKSARLVAHVANLTMFVAIDQLIYHWVQDIVLNVNYGRLNINYRSDAFPRKAEILYDLLEKESKDKYQNLSPVCAKDIQDYQCQSGDILGFLHNFSETMTKWKEFNKTKPMMAHQNWLQMVNEFQASEKAIKSFYGEFVDDIQQTEYYRKNPIDESKSIYSMSPDEATASFASDIELGKNGEAIDSEKYRKAPPMSNYITYPLYGVEPIKGISNMDYSTWKNLYLEDPDSLQKLQKETVKIVAKEFEKFMSQRGYDSLNFDDDKRKIERVISDLKSDSIIDNARAITFMRKYAESSTSGASNVVQAIFTDFLNMLGHPYPIMSKGLGFTYAIESSGRYRDLLGDFVIPGFYRNFGLATRFSFNKKTDYIYYHMLCGPQVESDVLVSSKYLKLFDLSTGIPNGLQTILIPPAIVNKSINPDICKKIFQFKNSSSMFSEPIVDESSGKTENGIFPIIFKNLRPDILEIINSNPKEEAFKNESEGDVGAFEKWWVKNLEPKVVTKINEFKDDYHEIAVDLFKSLFKENANLNKGVVENSIVYTNLQEARTYSMILAHVLKTTLTTEQYTSLLSTDKFEQKAYKAEQKQDIITFQKSPYIQDFEAMVKGNKPKVLKFQQYLEEILTIYQSTLKAFAIVKGKNLKGIEIEVVDTKIDALKIHELSKKIDELNDLINQDLDQSMQLLSKDNKAAKAISVITYIKTQIERISKELTLTFEMINLMSKKVTDFTKKILSEEEKKMNAEILKREKEQLSKRCTQYKTMGGSRPSGCN